MSTDYGEKERQFLETLKADTGRSLDEWMAAIAAEGLAHRNDIIDWLRRQGFLFSKASWIERIHNNGGRPIYGDAGSPRASARARPAAPRLLRPVAPAEAPRPPPPAPPQAEVAAPARAAEPDPAALDALLVRAKAFRPLAVYVTAEIRKAVPETAVVVGGGHLTFRVRERDFALLTIGPKELRLGLALKDSPAAAAALEPAKLAGAPSMTHMAVLTDARQITPALMAAAAAAASGA